MKKTGLRFLKYVLAGVLLLPSLTNLAFAEGESDTGTGEGETVTENEEAGEAGGNTSNSQGKKVSDIENSECKLTFVLPNFSASEEKELAELKAATKVTYIKVASIEEDESYDTYSYKVEKTIVDAIETAEDKTFVEKWLGNGYDGLKEITKTEWDKLAQIFANAVTITNTGAASIGTPADAGRGLYLAIAHDEKHLSLDTITGTDNSEVSVGTVFTSLYDYKFLPQLVSLPSPIETGDGKTVTHLGTLPSGTLNDDTKINNYEASPDPLKTSDDATAGWYGAVTLMLKPERSRRLISLEIRKKIDTYELGHPVTFVFSVDQVAPDTTDGYHNVISITFDDTLNKGTNSAVIEHIPYGITVQLAEIYAGSNYELVGGSPQTIELNITDSTIQEDGKEPRVIADVISNKRTSDNRDGWGIRNVMTYDGEDWSMEAETYPTGGAEEQGDDEK